MRDCVAVCCSVLQCVAVDARRKHVRVCLVTHDPPASPTAPVLQCVAVCLLSRTIDMCVALWLCVALCLCVAVFLLSTTADMQPTQHDLLLRASVFLGVLQFVAVYCSVLQCVAVWCSVVQGVAVCCSVLQCAAI